LLSVVSDIQALSYWREIELMVSAFLAIPILSAKDEWFLADIRQWTLFERH